MYSIINGFRKYTINEKTGTAEDILGFYPESYINSVQDLSSIKDEDILCDFIIKEKLGEGAFGSVRLGINKQTGEKVAIKILEKNKLKSEDKCRIEREINILKKLRHPNIVYLYSIIETDKQILIITEYIQGQELFHYILLKKKLTEEEACYYFTQIVSGVEYLQKLKIAHRDIKSENIIIDQRTKMIKIIDFGLSNTYGDKDEKILSTSCGSPLYAAPEMLKGEIYKGNTVDIWSIGVVLYFMLCGYLPFQDTDNTKLYKKIIQGQITIPMHVSIQARELLYKLMEINPRKRINVAQIKRHSWIRLYSNKNNNGINDIIFNAGLNLEKYVIPIDEEIIEELNTKFNLSKVKLRTNILMNKINDYTTLYELLLNKKISEGKNSVGDLKSELFIEYIKDKKNLMVYYNNDIKQVIKNRKMGYDIDLENNCELDKNKSQQDLYNVNDDFKIGKNLDKKDVKSPRFKSNIHLFNGLEKSDKNKFNLNFSANIITENDCNKSKNKNRKMIDIDTPFQRRKRRNKINSVRKNKSICKRKNRINSVENSLLVNKVELSNISNNNKKIKKIRKFVSVGVSKPDKNKINKLIRNKQNSIKKEINVKTENKNDSALDEKFNNINDNTKETINKLITENQINKTEESKESKEKISEKNSDKKEDSEKNETKNENSNEQISFKNNNSDNSKSNNNNYLITDEKIKYFQTLDSFSLKNSHEDNLFTNFIVEKVGMISFYPDKKEEDKNQQNNESKNKFHKVQRKSKLNSNKNRINLIKHKFQIQYEKENSRQNKKEKSVKRNRTPNCINKNEKIKKNIENKRIELSPMNFENISNNLDKSSLLHNNSCHIRKCKNKIIDTETFNNKKRNKSIYSIQNQNKNKIKKIISLDNDFRSLKKNNLSLELKVNEERNANHSLKLYRRNNKKISSNTQINEDTYESNKRRNDSNKNKKEFKFKESNNDINIHINIHRNDLNTKTYNVFSERQKQYTFYQNRKCDILDNIPKNKISQIIGINQLNKENKFEKIFSINDYVPFDLSCAFINSRKKLKQKIENICEKMKYKIKYPSLYKFNIIPGDKYDNIFEINLSVNNKLGIANFKKNKKSNIEQTNKIINKILSKIK